MRIGKTIYTIKTAENMTQKFYTKWQAATLADAGCSVSREYRRFQTALIHELTRYATASGAKVVSSLKGHYDTSCFIERNGRFVYISHSSTFSRTGRGVKIELDSFLIRTASHAKDYTGGSNRYCRLEELSVMIDRLLNR